LKKQNYKLKEITMEGSLNRIQKPLAIIAIFAGIVQISGIAVLPYLESENQSHLIWFLISFPLLLVLLFFITIYLGFQDHQHPPNRIAIISPSIKETALTAVPKSNTATFMRTAHNRLYHTRVGLPLQ
jgi:hypothetical protein